MRVHHPVAQQDDGVVDDTIDVNGESVPIADDGTFEVDDEAWLQRWCDANGYDRDAVVVDESDDGANDVVTAYAFPDGEELADLTVGEVKTRLKTGEFDHVLNEIESAEEHGKDRSTVHDAIESRRED